MNSILTGTKESINIKNNASDFTEDLSFIRDYMWERKYSLMGKFKCIDDESDFLEKCLPKIDSLLKMSINYDQDYNKLEEENNRLKDIENKYEEMEDHKKMFLKLEKEMEKLVKDLENEKKYNEELYNRVWELENNELKAELNQGKSKKRNL